MKRHTQKPLFTSCYDLPAQVEKDALLTGGQIYTPKYSVLVGDKQTIWKTRSKGCHVGRCQAGGHGFQCDLDGTLTDWTGYGVVDPPVGHLGISAGASGTNGRHLK